MTTYTAEPATTAQYPFGEGPRWDASTGALLWVDLTAGRLHRAPADDLDRVETLVELDVPLGAFAPCASGGFLLAAGRGLSHLAEDGTVRSLMELEPEGNRMNDAVCDLQGRFWPGSMALDEHEGAGALHRVDLDGTVVRVRGDVPVGNGPALSPDGRTLYLDDSGRAVTLAYDLDPDSGRLSGERVLVSHDRGAGDGLTVDDDGHPRVASFGGSAVHRDDPTGALFEVPTSQVSSVCLFEGRLFLTTVSEGLDAPEEEAGRPFVADVEVSAPAVQPYLRALPG